MPLLTDEQLKAIAEAAKGEEVVGLLKRIDAKLDTVIANQSGGGTSGGATGGDGI